MASKWNMPESPRGTIPYLPNPLDEVDDQRQDHSSVTSSDEREGFVSQHARRAGRGYRGAAKAASGRAGNGKSFAPQSKPPRQRPPSHLRRIINAWFSRLLGVAASRSFEGQREAYASHRAGRDYLWNTVGFTAWGMVFPLLTIVVTQLVGVEQAGMFSLAFVTATLLMILGNYGVRTFQVSDIEEHHSFSDYQVNRWLTCILMLVVGVVYCWIRGYGEEMFWMSVGVYLYRMVDALADVYEGRLQQKDKLYLAGISLTVRSVAALLVFSFFLLITHSLIVASFAMALVSVVCFVLLSFPLAHMETPKSRRMTFASVTELFKQCFPLFVALFMYSLIDNMPKFVMEPILSYANQLYFNALYFPAQAILLAVGFIYKPLLVTMAKAWADPKKRKRFDLFIVVILALVCLITAIMVFFMAWIGIPLMSFFYGVDFEQFRALSYVMLVAGGITGAIDFLYQVITVLRKQQVVMKLYLITFGFSLFIPILLISMTGLPGAVLGYLIVMSILAVLLVWEYIKVRIAYGKNPAADPSVGEAADTVAPVSVVEVPSVPETLHEQAEAEGDLPHALEEELNEVPRTPRRRRRSL